ncbi:MAG: serine/threonine protein kinase [Cyanobacteria bacterium REEB444]|nr:serine/threonine protein kinase [Cyanobacteria bacterium REEB444]
MLPLPSNSVLGCRYRILRSLGDGGFGQTFLAEDLKYPLQPQCVVKRLLPQSQNPSLLEITRRLFQKEIEVLKELGKHDRIPELLDSFEENGEFYLVQQYIDGEDLEGKIVGLNESETIHLIREVLEILEFVHGKSVIHRDIKPSNVIRRRHDDKLVVIDFGAVKQINSPSVIPSKKSVSVAVGTPGYMPSEQAGGRPKYNSDIYATGMLGIYALTGIQPGEIPRDENTGELIWRESVRCSLSLQFEAVLKKMVRDHFSLRYQTVTEVLKDLSEIPRTVVRESDDPRPTPTLPITKVSLPDTVVSEGDETEEVLVPRQGLTLQDWLKKPILWIFLLITGGSSIIVLSFILFKLPQASPVTATRGLYLLPRVVQGVQEGCCGTSTPSPTPVNSPSKLPLDDPPNPIPPIPPAPNPPPPAPPIPPKPNPPPPAPPPRNDDLPCSIAGC